MNNLNYGYSSPNNTTYSSSYSTQFSSTPSNNTRFQRPRFAYAGPPSYPRPRSSASKPNPDPYSEDMKAAPFNSLRNTDMYQDSMRDYSHGYPDSMRNNYGDSTLLSSDSLNANSSYGTRDSYGNSNSSIYYSGNDSFISPKPMDTDQYGLSNKGGFPPMHSNTYFNANTTGITPSLGSNLREQIGSFGTSMRGNATSGRGSFRGRFQKKNTRGGLQQGNFSSMAAKWRCETCSMDFTSQIPLEMHLRGAKHAKKLKTQSALNTIQGQTSQISEIEKADGKKFYCELCDVIANSSLQLQMHLDGSKHKAKLESKDPAAKESKEDKTGDDKKTEVNGKSNGGVVRPAPADFGDPKPAKMMKFSCDICNIFVNSDTQLQQHLTSKKHQAKVEGKPIVKKRKPKQGEDGEQPTEQQAEADQNSVTMEDDKPEVTSVVGVKTLSASFVQGGTLN